MTKTDAKNLGSEHGINYANTLNDERLMADLEGVAYYQSIETNGDTPVTNRADIKMAAHVAAVRSIPFGGGFRTVDSVNAVAYVESFVQSASMRFLGRRNELPGVKGQQLVRWTTRHIDREIEQAKAQCATFAEEFGKNPCYAFSWGERAMIAAAKLDIYTRILYSLMRGEGDSTVDVTPEAIVTLHKCCMREALRGAKNPSRSTSQTSNLIDDAKTSAYAEFVDYVGAGVDNFLGKEEL